MSLINLIKLINQINISLSFLPFVVENRRYLNLGKDLISISTSNHMFGRAIWDKCLIITRVIYPKNRPNQTCGY